MRKFILMAALVIAALAVNAANIQVTNAGLTTQDSTASPAFTNVKFDLSWEMSWRMSGGPANWDAAWIFVKYKLPGQDWKHATLSTSATDYSVGSGSPTMAFNPTSDGKGVFLYRSADGTGNISLTNVLLKWNYGTDLVANNSQVRVQVFAIEMAWVPRGPFFVGDGNMTTAPYGSYAFRRNSGSGMGYMPYLVNSEAAITFCNSTYSGTNQIYDPLYSTGYSLPASFPKGYDGFYCMKYEISQEQYADFFNTLPNTSVRSNRWIAPSSTYRNSMAWSGTYTDDIATTFSGKWRACSYISFADGCAYADWAALRPMTELEYEKACRGVDNTDTNNRKPIFPTYSEGPWGTSTFNYQNISTWWTNTSYNNLVNEQLSSTYNQTNVNIYHNTSYSTQYDCGPARCGIFAYRPSPLSWPTTDRKRWSGASYYGILELAGNVREAVVPTWYNNFGTPSNFAGQNGDGLLNANGNADVSGWQVSGQTEINYSNTSTYYQHGYRGGGWYDTYTFGYVSNRDQITGCTSRNQYNGMRCVREL